MSVGIDQERAAFAVLDATLARAVSILAASSGHKFAVCRQNVWIAVGIFGGGHSSELGILEQRSLADAAPDIRGVFGAGEKHRESLETGAAALTGKHIFPLKTSLGVKLVNQVKVDRQLAVTFNKIRTEVSLQNSLPPSHLLQGQSLLPSKLRSL